MSTPPTLVADRYRLVKMLGAGGMGIVWHAWDERLQRPVALKMLRTQPELTDRERELATDRAMREARITAGLHHPHAVTVFDVIEHEGQPCIVMQLIESTPLSDLLREHGTLTSSEAARIGAQVSSALAAAHKMRIVHRDVKPGNILITEDGSAMISDFGISHALGDATITATGMIHGTPAYLAPEVARGLPTSFASDVFSLGSTLYAALEGDPPFGSDRNAIALLHKVARGGYPPPKHAGPLAPLLRTMLSAQPKQRPAMASVAQSLAWLNETATAKRFGGTSAVLSWLAVGTETVNDVATEPMEDVATEPMEDVVTERVEDAATERQDDVVTEPMTDVVTERVEDAATERQDDVATERVEAGPAAPIAIAVEAPTRIRRLRRRIPPPRLFGSTSPPATRRPPPRPSRSAEQSPTSQERLR